MQIINQVHMPAQWYVATDKESRDHAAVVIKGTFDVDRSGNPRLAEVQRPFVYADEYNGEPGLSSIRYECDFVLEKPMIDVLVNGHAYAPGGRRTTSTDVSLEIGSISKKIRVFGDRTWESRVLGYAATAPKPFEKMPLTYERAFGGTDATAPKMKDQGSDLRNPVGAGFRINPDSSAIADSPLPNLEDPKSLISVWSDKPRPMCFAGLGRGWQPRIQYGGTYDQKWIDERYPFLPFDFDNRYFQAAPPDQQLAEVRGGEELRCTNMTPDGVWSVRIPKRDFAVVFLFQEHHVEVKSRLDTILAEPDERQLILTWRASIPLRTKLHSLQRIFVGNPTTTQRRAFEQGKPIFASLDDYIRWREMTLLS